MANKTTRGKAQDRREVAGQQDYEVGYEAKKTGTSGEKVKSAVKASGNQRKNVEKKLAKK